VVEVCAEDGSRIGYIMSASCMETDDEEILDKQHISNYVTRGILDYYKLSYDEICSNIPTELYKENTCIILLHKSTFTASCLDNVDIEAALVKLGFYTYDKYSPESFYSTKSVSYLQNSISNGRVHIKKINANFSINRSIFNTYLDSLHTFGSPLTQFLMLYQYFELAMGEIYMPRAEKAFCDLQSGQISKNDFRTIVSSLSKETGLLSEVLSGISPSRFDFIDSKAIEAKVVSPYPSNICDLIYSIRNSIIHRTISFYNDLELIKDVNSALLWTIYDIASK
jgi:hypothetical protein